MWYFYKPDTPQNNIFEQKSHWNTPHCQHISNKILQYNDTSKKHISYQMPHLKLLTI